MPSCLASSSGSCGKGVVKKQDDNRNGRREPAKVATNLRCLVVVIRFLGWFKGLENDVMNDWFC